MLNLATLRQTNHSWNAVVDRRYKKRVVNRFSRRWLWRMPFSGIQNPVRTSPETHYVSATEPSRLMVCKISSCNGGDYEECRLLGYKTPVHTSKETHNISAAELRRLMLCKIWGFHGGDNLECRLPECCTALLSPWWWRRYNPSNRLFLQEPHGITSQKTAFFNACFCWLGLSQWLIVTITVMNRIPIPWRQGNCSVGCVYIISREVTGRQFQALGSAVVPHLMSTVRLHEALKFILLRLVILPKSQIFFWRGCTCHSWRTDIATLLFRDMQMVFAGLSFISVKAEVRSMEILFSKQFGSCAMRCDVIVPCGGNRTFQGMTWSSGAASIW
jgi:hypothetical protein